MGHHLGTPFRIVAPLLLLAVAAGCSGSAVASGASGASSPSRSQPAGSGPAPSTGPSRFVPASGTDKSGLLFPTYRSPEGYRMIYPGGWHVSRKGSTVRIAKFGNAISVAVRPAKVAPKLKGIKAALKKQKAKGGLLAVTSPARTVKLGSGPAVRVVFTQARAASSTSDAATLVVYRYIMYHKGKVVVLSMLGPEQFDNRVVYRLIAQDFAWG